MAKQKLLILNRNWLKLAKHFREKSGKTQSRSLAANLKVSHGQPCRIVPKNARKESMTQDYARIIIEKLLTLSSVIGPVYFLKKK